MHTGATPSAPTESREEEGRGGADRPLSLHSHPALQVDITSLYNLKFQPPALGPEPAARTPEGSPVHGSGPSKDGFGELSRATIRLLEELDRERCFLLNEIEKEPEGAGGSVGGREGWLVVRTTDIGV